MATRHLERVRGKSFHLVDMEEKVGEPISEEQLKAIKTVREEIVYEYTDTDGARSPRHQ